MSSEERDNARLTLPLPFTLKAVIEEASAALGQSVPEYAVSTLVRDARAVLHHARVTELSNRDRDLLLAALDDMDAKPNNALADAADKYKQLFGLGGLLVVDRSSVTPPGESPIDPAVKDIDPVAFALDRARTYLHWIDEHRASFEAARGSDPETAERELGYLAHSTQEARGHIARLVELLLAGYTIDSSKRLPRGLARLAESGAAAPDPARDGGSGSS
jgi:uncharacterized protein (DUF1778 family)